MIEFKDRLKQLRVDSGFTQKEVCKKLNLSSNGYASYEQGRTQPNLEMLVKIANFFGVTTDYLLGLED